MVSLEIDLADTVPGSNPYPTQKIAKISSQAFTCHQVGFQFSFLGIFPDRDATV
jgi:hypothetical protein